MVRRLLWLDSVQEANRANSTSVSFSHDNGSTLHRRKGVSNPKEHKMSVTSVVNKEEAVMIAGESAMQHDISNGELEFTVNSTNNCSIGISKQATEY